MLYELTDFANFYLIPGIVLGSIYALGAIGITLTFGILRFANFAHGETMTLGVYFAWSLVQLTGWHPLAVMPLAMVLTVIVTLGLDRAFYKPLRNAQVIMLVMASFGLMLMVRSVVQFAWGVQVKSVTPGVIQRPLTIADMTEYVTTKLGLEVDIIALIDRFPIIDALRMSPKHLWIVSGALALMFAVHYLLTYTKVGKAMRAMSDSPELARLTGIDTEAVVRTTWIIGAALACAAGVFLAVDTHVETMMGFKLLLPMFAAAILGGVGKPYGAMAGGLIIGIAEELSTYPWVGDTPLLEPGYKAGVAFAIMILMLLVRPTGLFRGKVF